MSSKVVQDSDERSDDEFINHGDEFYPGTAGNDDDDDDEDLDDDNDDDVIVSDEEGEVSDDMSDNSDDLDGNDRKGRVISRLQPDHDSNEGGGDEGRTRPRVSESRRLKKGATYSTDSLLQGDFGRTLREQRRAKKKSDREAQGTTDSDLSDHSDLDGGGKGRVITRLQPKPSDADDSDLSDGNSDDMDGNNRNQRVVSRLQPKDADDDANDDFERKAPRPRVSFNRRIKKGATLSTDSLMHGDFGRGLREQRRKTKNAAEEQVNNEANDSDGTLSEHSDLDGDDGKPRIVMRIESKDELDDGDNGEIRPRPRRKLSPGRKIKKGSTLSTDSLMHGDFGRGLREQRRQKERREDSGNPRSPRKNTKQEENESSASASAPLDHRIVEISKTDSVYRAARNRPNRHLSTRSIDDPIPDDLDVPLDEGRQTRQSIYNMKQEEKESSASASAPLNHRIVELSKTDSVYRAARNRPNRHLSTRSIDDPIPDELDVPLDEGRQTRQTIYAVPQMNLVVDDDDAN